MTRSRARPAQCAESGFTLIELLVVMIVIGTLAGIAIPIFLRQRALGHDTSTKADVTNLGKEVATYFVDGSGTLSLDFTMSPGRVVLTDGVWASSVNLTNGTAAPTSGISSGMSSANAWCVALTDPAGAIREFRYAAASGLEAGTC